jgi:hypothetical protein
MDGSDWGNGNSVDSYVVELPCYTPCAATGSGSARYLKFCAAQTAPADVVQNPQATPFL